jgi:cell wall assembly regulator SMI1
MSGTIARVSTAGEVHLLTLLRDLEQIWREVGDVRTLAALRPGLSEAEVRARTAHLPAPLPPEAVVWFGWHDGGEAGQGYGPRIGSSHMEFLTLEMALRQYAYQCDFAADFAAEYGDHEDRPSLADAGWDPHWFPLFMSMSGSVAGIECSVNDEAAPIRVVAPSDTDKSAIDAPSLSDVVAGWIEMYRTGAAQWRDGKWDQDFSRTPRRMWNLW